HEAPEGALRELADLIRHLREAKGLGVRGLAAAAGIDATYVSRLEHAVYESPDPRLLAKLARALEIDAADLDLAAGYSDGRGLTEMGMYLRSKYDLPPEAVAQLEAHFDLIKAKYSNERNSP